MDNLQNSVELSELLLDKKIHTVETLQANRGKPPKIKNFGSLKDNEIIARDNEKVTVLAWKDKRVVKMTSTKHDSSTVRRQQMVKGKRGTREWFSKPACVQGPPPKCRLNFTIILNLFINSLLF